ncbi:LOW QUALITY PROTEIN: protein disulfide-isomerase TMX3 [Lepeophtheirus salmonis]|uniref:LOW QUALITY PROTEIN: protein disulfide-isomerase TMX3 n=1 Tax=Lepeophtheirus salmonis TaxID=72036 RepID=UPI001AEAC2C0|nr:LOW QUALITY PROTEIN: protein disulfide-isomerase TMX3-like [Lepeophtheirus salmonis]
MQSIPLVYIFICLSIHAAYGKVLELSDRFIPLKHEGMWLIKFYAPWCGHCKKLEPIWKLSEQSLAHDPVRVGRVDCTRFPIVATEFNIQGFPTILFLKGENQYTYEGDRTREDIVAFSKKLLGPSVTQIKTEDDFRKAMERSEIFFVYSGSSEGLLYKHFKSLAAAHQQYDFFYHAPPEIVQKFSDVSHKKNVIRVFKDGTSHKFEDNGAFEDPPKAESLTMEKYKAEEDEKESVFVTLDPRNVSLVSWVNSERFPLFMKVTRGKLNHLMLSKKLLVMAVLEENRIGELSEEMLEFKEMIKLVLERNLHRYRSIFQFGWIGSPELANSVAMETLSLPNLLVLNVSSYQHHLPDDDPSFMTPEAVQLFLEDIVQGSAPVYGGSSYNVRLYRAYYELRSNLFEMWKGNPALTAVLFGLPFGFFSLICYSICCADIMDAEEEDEDHETEAHEKVD